MNWIYNTLPDTARDVLACCKTNDNGNRVFYERTALNNDGTALMIPESWELIAWADFPRCRFDKDGNALLHWVHSVEGLK